MQCIEGKRDDRWMNSQRGKGVKGEERRKCRRLKGEGQKEGEGQTKAEGTERVQKIKRRRESGKSHVTYFFLH